ncbi:MAG: lytic transglycosylase domain-containing protein [Bacteroidia bacterium]|nr:lytic transglycosylase domain-containing protein [Bacteroidia bacterium]
MNISVWILRLFVGKTSIHLKTYFVFLVWFFIIFFGKVTLFKMDEFPLDYANTNFRVLGLNFPKKLSFAGEKVPLNDFEIKESLEKEFFENKSWKKSSLNLFIKAKKWFPLIEDILKKEGVPDDFKYVAIIESHLSNVISPMGAAGFWQLMPNTAQGYGLIINDDVDERYDVEKATYAACKHFKDAYSYFKNWTLSAAAYNVGIGGIQKALKKQNTTSYYDLLLNRETGSFIYRILAFKTLLSNPKHFGVEHRLKITSNFPVFKIVKVDSTITNLSAFANHLEIKLTTLKACNPWLIGDKLTNEEKHLYKIKIPKNKNNDMSSYEADLFPKKIILDTLNKIISSDSVKVTVDSLNRKS